MAFAIKISAPRKKDVNIFRQCEEFSFIDRYFAQTIESITNKGIESILILCDGDDPEEVDLSDTLIEAEEKLDIIRKIAKYFISPK